MFDKLLQSAFNTGGEVFVYLSGFSSPFRGRITDINDECFSLFQNGRYGTVIWAFRKVDLISCGLLVGPPSEEGNVEALEQNLPSLFDMDEE